MTEEYYQRCGRHETGRHETGLGENECHDASAEVASAVKEARMWGAPESGEKRMTDRDRRGIPGQESQIGSGRTFVGAWPGAD